MNGNSHVHASNITPKYSVEHTSEGVKETIQIEVALPGVDNSEDIQCTVDERNCRVRVAGRYLVDIPLFAPVETTADLLRFVKKRSVFRLHLRIKDTYVQQRQQQQEHSQQAASSGYADVPLPQVDHYGVPVAGHPSVTVSSGAALPSDAKDHALQHNHKRQLKQPSDMYAEAKQQANRDAAEECERLAWRADQQGDLQKAVRLLQKAFHLVPEGKYEQSLTEAERKLRANCVAGGCANSSNSSGANNSRCPAEDNSSATNGQGSPDNHEGSHADGNRPQSAAGAGSGAHHGAQQSKPQHQPQQQHSPPQQHHSAPQQQQSAPQQQHCSPQQQEAGGEAYSSAEGSREVRDEAQQRKNTVLGNSVSLLVGVVLVATAAYFMYGYGSPSTTVSQQLTPDEAAALLATAPAAVAAATAVVVGATGSSQGAASGPAEPPAASTPLPVVEGALDAWDWPGPLPPALKLMQLRAQQPTQGVAVVTDTTVGEQAADGATATQPGSAAETASPSSAETVRWLHWPWSIVKQTWYILSWLPRLLLWEPSWRSVGSWWLFVGGMHLALPAYGQLYYGDSESVAGATPQWRRLCVALAWQPLAWLACRGGWVAILEVLLEVVGPLDLWWKAHPGSFYLLSPVLFYLTGWPLRLVAPYAVGPLRLLVWTPRWYTHLPLAVVSLVYYVHESSMKGYWSMQAFLYLLQCWLAGGGQWGVATAVCLLGSPIARALRNTGTNMPILVSLMHMMSWASLGILAIKFVWHWSRSLWLSAPLGFILLGLIAVWQVAIAGGTGTGSSRSSGGERFRFFGAGSRPKKGSGGAPMHLEYEVPSDAPDTVARVLSSGNYYEVLGVDRDAADSDIRRAKRIMSLSTHPDKIGNLPGVNEAFNLVTEAADALCDPEKRREYEAELTRLEFDARHGDDAAGGGIFGGMGHHVPGGSSVGAEGFGFGLPKECDCCGGVHFMLPVPRSPSAARYCSECDTRHAVRDGEVWIERSSAGWFAYELKMYCCFGGLVWDITELALCEGLMRSAHMSGARFNTHTNPLGSFRASGNGGGGKGRQQQAAGTSNRRKGKSNKGKRR